MSERVDPGDIWEGIPKALREAVEVYGTSECTVGNRAVSGPLKPLEEARQVRSEAVKRLAVLFREAAADQARLDWLERHRVDLDIASDVPPAAPITWLGTSICGGLYGSGPTLREAIDAARGLVPSPTPTKEP